MFAIGTGPVSAANFRTGGNGIPPLPAIHTVVIEGDSITSTMPSTHAADFYSYRYGDHRPDRAVHVRAQNSRSVGSAANLDDGSNTLFGNVAEDAAYAPDLLTMMIGANDFTAIDDGTYRQRLIALRSAYASARPGMKIVWSPPIAYNPTGTPHSRKDHFDAQRASLLTDCRDPAVWSQWADFYLPMGEHPDFGDAALAAPLFGDSVHPSTAGQGLLFQVYKAAMDTLLDPSRANSGSMYAHAWPGNEGDLAPGTIITRRIIVSGLRHTGHEGGVAVSGGGSPSVKVGGRAPTGRVYNGDVVDLTLTVSSSQETETSVELTIGGETRTLSYRTAAERDPVEYLHGGEFSEGGPSNRSSFSGTFAAGKPLLVFFRTSPAQSVTVGGEAAVLRESRTTYDGHGIEMWEAPVQAGGTLPVDISYAGSSTHRAVAYGTITGGSFVASANGPSGNEDPRLAPALTVPANGLLMGAMGVEGLTASFAPPGCGASTGFAAESHVAENGETYGVVIGQRAASGQASFTFDRYGSFPLLCAVYRAGE